MKQSANLKELNFSASIDGKKPQAEWSGEETSTAHHLTASYVQSFADQFARLLAKRLTNVFRQTLQQATAYTRQVRAEDVVVDFTKQHYLSCVTITNYRPYTIYQHSPNLILNYLAAVFGQTRIENLQWRELTPLEQRVIANRYNDLSICFNSLWPGDPLPCARSPLVEQPHFFPQRIIGPYWQIHMEIAAATSVFSVTAHFPYSVIDTIIAKRIKQSNEF